MKKIIATLCAMLMLACAAGAQGWFRQPTPNDTLRSTFVLLDKSVVFQIYAPKAEKVAVTGDLPWDKPAKFVKEENGVWKGRISAMTEGLYRYRFIVDGVSVYDPKAPSASETSALLSVGLRHSEQYAVCMSGLRQDMRSRQKSFQFFILCMEAGTQIIHGRGLVRQVSFSTILWLKER